MSSQFLQESAVRNSVKGFTKVRVEDINMRLLSRVGPSIGPWGTAKNTEVQTPLQRFSDGRGLTLTAAGSVLGCRVSVTCLCLLWEESTNVAVQKGPSSGFPQMHFLEEGNVLNERFCIPWWLLQAG